MKGDDFKLYLDSFDKYISCRERHLKTDKNIIKGSPDLFAFFLEETAEELEFFEKRLFDGLPRDASLSDDASYVDLLRKLGQMSSFKESFHEHRGQLKDITKRLNAIRNLEFKLD